VQNSGRRVTRSSTRGGQSLLERLFEIVDDDDSYEHDSMIEDEANHTNTLEEDIEEIEVHTRHSRNPRRNRRLTTLRNISRNTPERQVSNRRNTRASGVGILEEDFETSFDDIDSEVQETRSTRTRRNQNTRMNAEDLNEFRYPLRRYDRTNS